MSRFHSYLNTASLLVSSYDGKAPFSFHIKNYFRSQKKHGSRDRNLISSLCYNYFRTGHLFRDKLMEEAMIKSWFLCNDYDPGFLEGEPRFLQLISSPSVEKLDELGFSTKDIFPFYKILSSEIDAELFSLSMLTQPDLFIRIRPGKEQAVIEKLQSAGVDFQKHGNSTLRLPNKTSVEKYLYPDKEIVIQDSNSQHVLDRVCEESKFLDRQVLSIWDCCAASGGKTILAADVFPQRLSITVSDIRSSILSNLRSRLETAGIPVELSLVLDLEKQTDPGMGEFDIIICDAPCTGSGTWSRTPEEFFYFKPSELEHYSLRQLKIATNAIRFLKPGGFFSYITCSVFKNENEDIVDQLKALEGIELITQEYLSGYDSGADTMFTAVFRKLT